MSQLDIFFSRRSIRKYLDKPIPKDVITKILEAGRQAPSAGNGQPWHFIVITEEHTKEELSHGRYNTFLKDAAAVIVACGYVGTDESKKWSTVDTTIALENIVLAAWTMGIGSCWIGDFKEAEVKKLLGIPDTYRVVCVLSLGYPAHSPEAHPRKTMEEIVSYERW